jgi:ubiquinone/menaquinone biosynthesis C-methylase UbiE
MGTPGRELVLRTNEIWHDLEGPDYDRRHPEIIIGERKRWEEIGQRWIASDLRELRLLDVGCGTGFVPLQIGRYLKKGDVFVCTDLSARMLEICKENLSTEGFECEFQFLKADVRDANLPGCEFGYITMNSVLHHIPTTANSSQVCPEC